MHDAPARSEWRELAPGVFHRRYDPVDVSIGAIVGLDGVTIIDTRNNPAEGEELILDATTAFSSPIVAVVNTHAHYDHCFGNQVFAARGIPIYGHHRMPAHLADFEAPHLRRVQAEPDAESDKQWVDVILTPPTVLVHAPTRISPGGRDLELVPVGPGHTDSDLAVHVPDAGVWFLGDVIEQSGPPSFGPDSFPLGWPDALEELLTRIRPDDVLVPGHGDAVDREFVVRQAARLRAVADQIRHSRRTGIPLQQVHWDAATREIWPDATLRTAIDAAERQLASNGFAGGSTSDGA